MRGNVLYLSGKCLTRWFDRGREHDVFRDPWGSGVHSDARKQKRSSWHHASGPLLLWVNAESDIVAPS